MNLKTSNTAMSPRDRKPFVNGKRRTVPNGKGMKVSQLSVEEEKQLPSQADETSVPHVNGKVTSGSNGTANGVSAVVPRPLRLSGNNDCVVIREVYENGLASEFFALQLDYALEADVSVIVIEPSQLGRETAQWLGIGATLRRAALSAGFASIVTGSISRDSACFVLSTIAGALATVYSVSWRPDPCSGYRVERNSRNLQRLPLTDITCTAPVVLVRRRRSRLRHAIYDSVAVGTFMMCAWRLYKFCKQA